ncbi:MAG TPA: DUF6240 domain-containing protein [Mobilitalea sp.]|nr:DUF6240 domain-containing protein [Mobilitalea sp.]
MNSIYKESEQGLASETVNKKRYSGTISGNADRNAGLPSLIKGQQITGLVTAIGDGITFSINGLEVKTSRDMFPEAHVGEIKLFEVLKVTDMQIQLGAADGTLIKNGGPVVAIMRQDADRDVLMSRKEHLEKKAEREKENQNTESKMNEIIARMSEHDYQTLAAEGFPVEDYSVTALYAALGRIKSAKWEEDRAQGKGWSGQENYIQNAKSLNEILKEANLPANRDTVLKVRNALTINDSIKNLDDNAFEHLLRMEQSPTIENLYKAQYSSNAKASEKPIMEVDWKELVPQVREVIEEAGYEQNNENLESARWLLEHQLPLTKDNFSYYSELKNTKVLPDKNEVLGKILKGLEEGVAPKDILLLSGRQSLPQGIVEGVNSIADEAILTAVKADKEITIKVLTDISSKLQPQPEQRTTENISSVREHTRQDSFDQKPVLETKSQEITDKQQLEIITAQRQLEEIRLKMTVDVAARLEGKGFHIETQRLEKVVEELRRLEDTYYKNLLAEADLEGETLKVDLLKNTTQSMEQLKYTPSFVLGLTLSSRKLITVPTLLEEGNKLTSQLDKAKEAYEHLMTEPNREYGDSIQKAFKNTGSMLTEMGMDNTEYNRRAVKILGYNRMDITEANIEQVKAYDLEVNTLIKNLHPALTVRLIKEGINPLELPIGELNQKIEQIREEQGITSEEKYSTYLRRLEKESGITKEERKAYIGIYRLLHNIEKTDGAALGAVIKSDWDVTLNHLLTAVRSLKKGTMNTIVDDSFGTLESLTFDKESITEQLNSVFGSGTGTGGENQEEQTEGSKGRMEFLDNVLKQLLEEVTPEKLGQVQEGLANLSQPEAHTLQAAAPLLSSDRGIWESIKDVPVEVLYDQLGSTTETDMTEDPIYAQRLQEIREAYKNPEQAIRFLDDFKVPCTTTNIMLAGQILSNKGNFFKRINKLKDIEDENLENKLQKTKELADTLTDRDTMNETYEQLGDEVEAVLAKESNLVTIDSFRLAELKSLGEQMSLMKTLARKEFYQIPVETKGGITNINLTVVRGAKSSGKVSVNLQSESLGGVKAELSLKDKTLNGYIACDSRSGLKTLQGNLQKLNNTLQEEKVNIKQLDLCFQKTGSDTYSYMNQESESMDSRQYADMERLLYRIARSLVLTVRAAEEAETDVF